MRRLLYIALLAVLAFLLPFGVILLSIPILVRVQIAKIDSTWTPASAVIYWSRFWCTVLRVDPKLHLVILYNEGASVARPIRATEVDVLGIAAPIVYPVGDIGDSRGPSLGSGQVLRINCLRFLDAASALIRWALRVDNVYRLATPGYERQAMYCSVKTLQECIAQEEASPSNALEGYAGASWGAAKRYNGGPGSDPRALAYATKAQDNLELLES